MSKFIASLLVFVAFVSCSWAACCATRSAGPIASAPVYAACVFRSSFANYGGTGTFTTDGDFFVGGPIDWKAELNRGDIVQTVATRNSSSAINCNATTQISIWTASDCVCKSGFPYYSKVSFSYIGLCMINTRITVSASSTSAICP